MSLPRRADFFLVRVLRTRGRGSTDEYARVCESIRLSDRRQNGEARQRDLQNLVRPLDVAPAAR